MQPPPKNPSIEDPSLLHPCAHFPGKRWNMMEGCKHSEQHLYVSGEIKHRGEGGQKWGVGGHNGEDKYAGSFM